MRPKPFYGWYKPAVSFFPPLLSGRSPVFLRVIAGTAVGGTLLIKAGRNYTSPERRNRI